MVFLYKSTKRSGVIHEETTCALQKKYGFFQLSGS